MRQPGGSWSWRSARLTRRSRLLRGEADQTLGVAPNETEAILAKARRQAEQITGDAAARARALELDAQERHHQAMGSLIQNREELERRVDDLRAFEREYRAKLQAWLEGQFRELLEGVTGPGADQTIKDLRKRASESPGQRVSAVLLREDGTYEVVQFGTSTDRPAARGTPDSRGAPAGSPPTGGK